MRNTTTWGIGSTKTFRNRSYKILNKYGQNLQNPSERICRMHIPDENKEFVQADQAGAEALVFAYECNPGKFRLLFEHSIKPHVFIALHIFCNQWRKETPYDALHLCTLPISDLANHPHFQQLSKIIKNHKERYFIGKKTCHSFNYEKTASSFRFDVLKESEGKIVLSLMQAEIFESMYHGLLPEIKQEQARIKEQVKATRTLHNLFGYPMHFGGNLDDKGLREAIAWKFQSTVGIIASDAFALMQDYIEDNQKTEWDVLNNKHDSVLCQAPIGEGSECGKILKGFLERDLVSTRGVKFKMKAEVSIGQNWAKYDKDKNPEGLKEVSYA